MTISPLISIVVPMFNVERYIDECMDSIRCQTYRNIEIIVVDDCSKDGSFLLAEAHSSADCRVKILRHKENKGLSSARNSGLAAASGDYIVFVDSDDVIEPYLVEVCVEASQTGLFDVVLYGHAAFQDGTAPLGIQRRPMGPVKSFDVTDPAYFERPYFAWKKFVRHNFIKDNHINFLEGYYYEDHLFHWELGLMGASIAEVSDVVYHYRLRYGAITSFQDSRLIDIFKMYRRIVEKVDSLLVKSSVKNVLIRRSSSAIWAAFFNVDRPYMSAVSLEIRHFIQSSLPELKFFPQLPLHERSVNRLLSGYSTSGAITLRVLYEIKQALKFARLRFGF